jgi:uncharacterized protein YbjT (DUF2867 family)
VGYDKFFIEEWLVRQVFVDALAEADRFAATGELPKGFDLSQQPPEEAEAGGELAEQLQAAAQQEQALGKAPGRPRGSMKGQEGRGAGASAFLRLDIPPIPIASFLPVLKLLQVLLGRAGKS